MASPIASGLSWACAPMVRVSQPNASLPQRSMRLAKRSLPACANAPKAAATTSIPRLEISPRRTSSGVDRVSSGAAGAASAATSLPAACPRRRTSASSASAWSIRSTRICASGLTPPADSRRTSATPASRCSSDCCRLTLWIRANGISRRLRCSQPLRMVIASRPSW